MDHIKADDIFFKPYLGDNHVDRVISLDSEAGSNSVQDPLKVLPEELALEIFSYLTAKELVETKLVCREWKRVASDDTLFPIFFRERLPVTAARCTYNELKKDLYERTIAFQSKLEDSLFFPDIKTFDSHASSVTFIKSGRGSLMSSSENDLKVFDRRTGKEEVQVKHTPIRCFEQVDNHIYIGDKNQGRITKLSMEGELLKQVCFSSTPVYFLKKGNQGLYASSNREIQSFDLELKPLYTIKDKGRPMSLSLSSTTLFTGGGEGVASFDIETRQETHRFLKATTCGRNLESMDNQAFALLEGTSGVVAQMDFRADRINWLFNLAGYNSLGLVQVLEHKILIDYSGQVWVVDLRMSKVVNKITTGSQQDQITALYVSPESIFVGKKNGEIFEITS